MINVGDFYLDCSYHPVYCNEVEGEGDDLILYGYSMLDGSCPRSCSVKYCDPEPLTIEQVAELIKHRDLIEEAHRKYYKDTDANAYDEVCMLLESIDV